MLSYCEQYNLIILSRIYADFYTDLTFRKHLKHQLQGSIISWNMKAFYPYVCSRNGVHCNHNQSYTAQRLWTPSIWASSVADRNNVCAHNNSCPVLRLYLASFANPSIHEPQFSVQSAWVSSLTEL